MTSQLVLESFAYGNYKLSLKDNIEYSEQNIYNIIEYFNDNIHNRDLESLWCVIWNIQSNIDVYKINFFKFTRIIFDIIEEHFEPDYSKVNFENFAIMKCFVINDINYVIDAYTLSDNPIDSKIINYYTSYFRKELEYIKRFSMITKYNLPGENLWKPEWSINYDQNSIKTSIIDLYLDHFISNPFISYASNMNDILSKIITRLTFLKSRCPTYYSSLESSLAGFSFHVFTRYPYYEISKHYENLVKVSDNVYIPNNIPKEEFTGLSVIFSAIPEILSSYILGLPCISMGSLTPELINMYTKELMKDKNVYFRNLEEKNKNIIKSRMFIDKCSNGCEGENIINLLYLPVKSYNIDDVTVIISNGTCFVFTYPEYDDILNRNSNPYNRDDISNIISNRIKNYTNCKKGIISDCRYRGLCLNLGGTMEQNFDELIESINEYIPQPFESGDHFHGNSIINSILRNLIEGNF